MANNRRSRPQRSRQLQSTQTVQARAEGITGEVVDDPDTVGFLGERYRIADAIGLMPMMEFAHVAKQGADSLDLDGIAAMYALLRDCIADDEWPRFKQDATDKKADGEQLFAVVKEAMEKAAARPTRRSSDSSDGPHTTSPNSKALPGSPGTDVLRLLRPDVVELQRGLVSVDELLARSTG